MPDENVTSKFKIDISDLKAGITEANKQIKLANAEFKAAAAGMDDWQKSTDGVEAKLKQLNTLLDTQKGKLENYKTQLAEQQKAYNENAKRAEELKAKLQALADAGIAKTSEEYKKYQKALADVQKEQANNEKAMEDLNLTIINQQGTVNGLEKDIRKYNQTLKDLKTGAEEAASGNQDFAKATEETSDAADDAGEKLDGLSAIIAKGLLVGLGALVTSAVAAGKALWDMAESTAKAGDEIDKQSQKLGVSAENYQKLSYAMERCGADVEDFRKGASNISKSLAQIGAGSEEASAEFEALGVSVKDSSGNIRSTEDVLLDTIAALADMDDETQRNASANAIFGKSYQELSPLLNSGAEGIRELMDEAEEYGMVMSNDAVKASAEFEDSLTRFKGTISGIKDRIATKLLPSLSDMLDGFSMLVAGVDGGSELIKKGIHGISETITTILPEITGIIKTISGELTKPENLTQITDAGVSMIAALLSGIIEALPQLIDVALGSAGSLLENVTGLSGFSDFLREQKTVIEAAIAALIAYKAATAISSAVSVAVTAVKSLTAAFEGMNAAASMNPIGLIAAAATGAFVLIDNAMRNSATSVMEAADDMTQSIKGIAAETENVVAKQADLETIASKYEKINKQISNEDEKKRQLKNLQKELNDLYGDEVRKIDLVNGKYEEQIGLLGDMTERELGVATRKAEKALDEANKKVADTIKEMSGNSIAYIAALGEEAVNGPMEDFARKYNRTLDEASGKYKGFLDMTADGFTFNFTGEESIEEVIGFYSELLDVMEKTGEGGNGVAEGLQSTFDDIYTYSKQLEAAGVNVDSLRESLARLQEQANHGTWRATENNLGMPSAVKSMLDKQAQKSTNKWLPSYVEEMMKKGSQASTAIEEAAEEGAEIISSAASAAGSTTKKVLTFATKQIGEYTNLGVVKQLGKALTETEEEADRIAAAVWSKSQETFARSIKNDQLSISDQIKGWEVIRDQFVKNSDQWIAANDKVIESQQKLEAENKKTAENMVKDTQKAFENMKKEAEELQKTTEKAVEKLQDDIVKLRDDYSKAVSDRANEIMSQYDLFAEVPERAEKSGEELMKNLNDQVNSIEHFYKSIDELSSRGVSAELVESIRSMGVKASGELDALLRMTDTQLEAYDAKFAEKRTLSTQIAEDQLEPLKQETDRKIAEIEQQITDMKDNTAKKIAEMKVQYMLSIANAGLDMARAFTDNMSSGIEKGAKKVVTKTKEAITEAWQQAFGGFKVLGSVIPGLTGNAADNAITGAVNATVNKAMVTVVDAVNDVLNRLSDTEIAGIQPFAAIGKNTLKVKAYARGGVLKRGEVGLLEGTGAEAVVPLDQNKKWIRAVVGDLLTEMKINGAGSSVNTSTTNRDYNFTQVINAPKAPSRIELYRQTRNLLAYAGESGGM